MSRSDNCRHPSDGKCSCGEIAAIDRVEVWDAINEYVVACGGDPSARTVSDRRMNAVVRVENALAYRGVVTDEIGRWVQSLKTKLMFDKKRRCL